LGSDTLIPSITSLYYLSWNIDERNEACTKFIDNLYTAKSFINPQAYKSFT